MELPKNICSRWTIWLVNAGSIPHLIHSRNHSRKPNALGVRLFGELFGGSIYTTCSSAMPFKRLLSPGAQVSERFGGSVSCHQLTHERHHNTSSYRSLMIRRPFDDNSTTIDYTEDSPTPPPTSSESSMSRVSVGAHVSTI
jgi:hypothetical protein